MTHVLSMATHTIHILLAVQLPEAYQHCKENLLHTKTLNCLSYHTSAPGFPWSHTNCMYVCVGVRHTYRQNNAGPRGLTHPPATSDALTLYR